MAEKIKMTKRSIAALTLPTSGRVTYQDTNDRYLHLVLNRTGMVWRYVRKIAGRVIFLTLGKNPPMTPDQARVASRETSAAYVTGRDPQQERRASRKITTWNDLFTWYMDAHSKPFKKSWKGDQYQEALYCASWRTRAWQTLTPDTVTRWHRNIGTQHGKFAADRALALVRTVFNKAMAADLITGRNPATGATMFHPSSSAYSRDRFLQADELKRLFTVLDGYPDQSMADFFKLCIYTGARRGNVMAMRWPDFDRERAVWTIPSGESKNKEPMLIPLLRPAVEILNLRWDNRKSDEWVFPSARSNPKTPHLTEPKTAWKTICKTADLQGVRIHDLRRTMGSWQAICGASLAIIGKSLGHKNTRATEIYARLTMDPVRNSMDTALTAMLQAANGGEKEVTKQ